MNYFRKIKFILSIASLVYAINVRAQKVQYAYDKNGGGIQRKLYITPPPPCNNCPPPGGRDAAPVDTTQIVIAQHVIGLFPNPTQDKVNLNISNLKDDETTEVVVTDGAGKTFYSAKNLQAENQINMGTYSNGTYFVRISIGKDVLVYKVIKVQ
jgi:hypothetical protein